MNKGIQRTEGYFKHLNWVTTFKAISAKSIDVFLCFISSLVKGSFPEGRGLLFHLTCPHPAAQICIHQCNLHIPPQLCRNCFRKLPRPALCHQAAFILEAILSWHHSTLIVTALQNSLGKAYYSLIKTTLVYHDLQWATRKWIIE